VGQLTQDFNAACNGGVPTDLSLVVGSGALWMRRSRLNREPGGHNG
jgi:hypothetical protein